LITPRALTSLATVVGLVYSLHAPVRYVMRMGATVDALNARVATLETEIDHQRGTIAAAELVLIDRNERDQPARERASSHALDTNPPAGWERSSQRR
jgi:hypothetical protein